MCDVDDVFLNNEVLFFFNDTATTEIYTLSLHDALPILVIKKSRAPLLLVTPEACARPSLMVLPPPKTHSSPGVDRKSTRLNSSHANISYAVFCLKKKTTNSTLLPVSV